jgi:amino acid adenylation domain-containing protein
MLVQSESDILVVGEEGFSTLDALLPCVSTSLTVLLPDQADAKKWEERFPQYRFVVWPSVSSRSPRPPIPCADPDAVAYLLFTSGSTGTPKGVPVSQKNVTAYVRPTVERYQVTEHDRFSQMFDLTFDLSAHDLFVCWERGACLYSVPERSVMAPAKFIRDHRLTMWFSVPSVVGFMSKMGMLKPACFPSLRISLFCGEPLPSASVQAWRRAASHSIVENLYGPTETTIAITRYRWDDATSLSACRNGIVPIGWAFEGQDACVIDGERHPVSAEERGELCVAGSQVTEGYWRDSEKTADRFIRLAATEGRRWYRTGDLVTQGEDGCLYYLGRTDHQVKIRGYRVELQEIDCALRKAAGTDQAVAVAWPVRDGVAEGIVAFVCGGADLETQWILNYCRDRLPDYMVPRKICLLETMPLNVNGKTDRSQLVRMLEDRDA